MIFPSIHTQHPSDTELLTFPRLITHFGFAGFLSLLFFMPRCLLLENLTKLPSCKKASAWRLEESHDHHIWYVELLIFVLADRIFMNLIAEMLNPKSRRISNVANTKGNSRSSLAAQWIKDLLLSLLWLRSLLWCGFNPWPLWAVTWSLRSKSCTHLRWLQPSAPSTPLTLSLLLTLRNSLFLL